MQIEETYLWTETVHEVLEGCTWLSPTKNGVQSIEFWLLHLHVRRRRPLLHQCICGWPDLGRERQRWSKSRRSCHQSLTLRILESWGIFFRMSTVQNQKEKKIWMGQPTYTEKLLSRIGMSNWKPVSTPADPSSHLVKAAEDEKGDRPTVVPVSYQKPDVSSHLYKARYSILSGSAGQILKQAQPISLDSSKTSIEISEGHLQSGNCFQRWQLRCTHSLFRSRLGGRHWRQKIHIQVHVLHCWRTCIVAEQEAEHSCPFNRWSRVCGTLKCCSGVCVDEDSLRRLNSELGNSRKEPTTIMEDNQSCFVMAKNPQHHGRSKHIDIKYHFVWELVENETIKLKYYSTKEMIADILIKNLNHEQFCYLHKKAGIESHEWGVLNIYNSSTHDSNLNSELNCTIIILYDIVMHYVMYCHVIYLAMPCCLVFV